MKNNLLSSLLCIFERHLELLGCCFKWSEELCRLWVRRDYLQSSLTLSHDELKVTSYFQLVASPCFPCQSPIQPCSPLLRCQVPTSFNNSSPSLECEPEFLYWENCAWPASFVMSMYLLIAWVIMLGNQFCFHLHTYTYGHVCMFLLWISFLPGKTLSLFYKCQSNYI